MYAFSPKPITFLYLLFLSLPTFIFSLSRIGAESGEEWLKKEEQRVWTLRILSVAFCWLTFSVFNHRDYGRYLKPGISVQFGGDCLWGLRALLEFFSPDWTLSLIESIKGALCLLPFASVYMPTGNSCICVPPSPGTVRITFDSSFILPSRQSFHQLSAFRPFSINSKHILYVVVCS